MKRSHGCGNCLFAAQQEVDPNNIGAPRSLVCFRNPPVPYLVNTTQGQGMVSMRPQVMATDWCGEHAAAGAK